MTALVQAIYLDGKGLEMVRFFKASKVVGHQLVNICRPHIGISNLSAVDADKETSGYTSMPGLEGIFRRQNLPSLCRQEIPRTLLTVRSWVKGRRQALHDDVDNVSKFDNRHEGTRGWRKKTVHEISVDGSGFGIIIKHKMFIGRLKTEFKMPIGRYRD
ncbi:unnamed protein product [Linum tenue]|uniref:Uncharacterized protein n=1 Tax=Linum tenue TaxID=586396 RepID=A0AAV0RF81_9ROSI|nr:unnamed protein product [Linum tenue]